MVSTSEELSKLEFCSAVFKEALRLRTPARLMSFYGTVKSSDRCAQQPTMLLASRKACLRMVPLVGHVSCLRLLRVLVALPFARCWFHDDSI